MRSVRRGVCSGGSAYPAGRVLRTFYLRRWKLSRNDPGHGKSNHAQRSLPRRASQVARGTTRPRPGPFRPQTAPFSFFKGGGLPLGRASDPTLTYLVLPPLRGSQSPTPQRSRLKTRQAARIQSRFVIPGAPPPPACAKTKFYKLVRNFLRCPQAAGKNSSHAACGLRTSS